MERIIKICTLIISWNRTIKIGTLVGIVVGIDVDAVLELEVGWLNEIEVRAVIRKFGTFVGIQLSWNRSCWNKTWKQQIRHFFNLMSWK